MKTLGLIGGMSWESSLAYYRIINKAVAKRIGGLHSAQCILYSVDFGEYVPLLNEDDWDAIGRNLSDAALMLKRAAAECIVLCTNTMHKVSANIESIGLPMIHIADVTARAIRAQRLSKVALLGTRFTMEEDFFRARLTEGGGFETIIPPKDERDAIDSIIFQELCRGEIHPVSRDILRRIVGELADKGAEGIILGCTELPLIIKQADVPIPIFDTTELHALAAVEFMLG